MDTVFLWKGSNFAPLLNGHAEFESTGLAAKKDFIEREVAFRFGALQQQFHLETLNEECVENMDKTHFILNIDSGKMSTFKDVEEAKRADVTSGDEGVAIVVRLSGGRDAFIEPTMMI